MATVIDILARSAGARFYRGDLHVHSYGASHDVKDTAMTPEAIVQTAQSEGLAVVAITDHNEITNVDRALKAAVGTSLLVVPGIELSTPQGHLLCYLPTLAALQQFHGRLRFGGQGTSNSNCQNSMFECLIALDELGGFGVLAHVDGPGGFEKQLPGGASPHRADVICHRALLGIELAKADSSVSYSDRDHDANRTKLGEDRKTRLGLGSRQYLARVLNSDAHTLTALGRNAQGDTKVSRFKMDEPSFAALRIAFDDADARVRIEELIPPSVPFVLGMAAEGGFLDGLEIRLSSNLNCIIGGRGTGKSTTFEAIRCLIAGATLGEVVDSEVWPDKVRLFWQDQAGQQHTLDRAHGTEVVHADDPDGPISFHIESYTQGETAHLNKEARDNPIALMSYLDRFVEVGTLEADENIARDEVLAIREQIELAQKQVDRIPTVDKDLTTTKQQIAALDKANAKEIIALQRSLEGERAVRAEISTKLGEIGERLDELDFSADLEGMATLADPATLSVGSTELTVILKEAATFGSAVKGAHVVATTAFKSFKKAADASLAAWKAKEATALAEIDAKKKELESKNIRLDMTFIQKLTRDEAKLTAELKVLRAWPAKLKKLVQESSEASKRRWAARAKLHSARAGYAKKASETLRSVLTDLQVTLRFLESAHSPDAEDQIKSAMEWRTSKVPRAQLMLRQMSLPGLINAIDKKDVTAFLKVKTRDGVSVFDQSDARTVIERLSSPTVRFALERSAVYDIPLLTVTGPITLPDGKQEFRTREFSKLSLGQQQSVLLALMLSSKSNAPLIIDQPEDNLDGEFIYKTLVPVLRLAKERRQIIVVTHNANVAVLGDAEQVVILKSTNDRGSVVSEGSIDDPTTRDAACAILEGAKEAFQHRARIYGIN